jgi:tRNA 2-thiocytidine biosynthesis protein TtcA
MNTRPSHLLDPAIFDFKGLETSNEKSENSSEIPNLR